MARSAVIDFFDDRESLAVRHIGPDPDAIYTDLDAAFESEGFDSITLFTVEEWAEAAAAGWDTIESLPTLAQLA
jgi:hypothetical protein